MIDNKLLNAYVAELEALRTHGRDLAQTFPDIAARLDIGPRQSSDPHVERVVESAAFLAARLRMMMEESAAEIPVTLLSMLAPNLLEPVPSMALAEIRAGHEPRAVPRGSRFDIQTGGQAVVCFSTTMDVTAAPVSLRLRRFAPPNHADGLAVRIVGTPPDRLLLCLGNDELSATALLDGLSDDLAAIQIVAPGTTRADASRSVMLSPQHLRFHGFSPEDAALPARPASHQAHRILTEFMAFPEKFGFVSLTGAPLANGTEIRFIFSRPLALTSEPADDLITTNRVPVVNLWPTAATPFDVSGRQLEYPVRVDTMRYRLVECHSVEAVDMFGPEGGEPTRLDPMMGLGDIRSTALRWGTRRVDSRAGAEVMLFFRGLDYQTLGRYRHLAAPRVLASNCELPQKLRIGSALHPLRGIGEWQCVLASVPTPYRRALGESPAMATLIGYLKSSVTGIAAGNQRGSLKDYLRNFPGGGDAPWVDALGHISFRPIASTRDGFAESGMAAIIAFDAIRCRTTSRAIMKRVLAGLFESQRGINRVQETIVVTG